MTMTKESFLTSLRAIETECSNKKSALCRIFVQENAKAQVGSIVTDGEVIIHVDRLSHVTLNQIPSIQYVVGIKVKKNYERYKRCETWVIHESHPNFRIIKK